MTRKILYNIADEVIVTNVTYSQYPKGSELDDEEQALMILQVLHSGVSGRVFAKFAQLLGISSNDLSRICVREFGV